LNEPETSLHPDLLVPLASLVATAATRAQLVVVSHAVPLVRAMAAVAEELGVEVSTVELVKDGGATYIAGQKLLDAPSWHWPKR
jgi:predicted ATPase